MNNKTQHCGFMAVIGATNAGKSTLINQLVGHKISIVSRKVQTTRSRILGIIQEHQHQILLVDTPGIFHAKNRLERAMVDQAWRSISDSGIAVHVVDSVIGCGEYQQQINQFLKKQKVPAVLCLNKIDLIEKPKLLGLIDQFRQENVYQDIIPVSATTGAGVDHLRGILRAATPEGPFLYDTDQISDLPMRLWACEIVREKLFDRLHQELPYGLTVMPEKWEDCTDGSIKINLCILVKKSGHKGIVIGKGGQTLKAIGREARHEIARLFEVPKVHLSLYVKHSERWQDDSLNYTLWGLNYQA